MSDATNKTPGQVAYEIWCGDIIDANHVELWNRIAAAVLAHAAPKWHPVSEPVPKSGEYHIRHSDGSFNRLKWCVAGEVIPSVYDVTHWQGPIEPPPF